MVLAVILGSAAFCFAYLRFYILESNCAGHWVGSVLCRSASVLWGTAAAMCLVASLAYFALRKKPSRVLKPWYAWALIGVAWHLDFAAHLLSFATDDPSLRLRLDTTFGSSLCTVVMSAMTAAYCGALVQTKSPAWDAAFAGYLTCFRTVSVGLSMTVEGHPVRQILLSLPLAAVGSICTAAFFQPMLFSFLGDPTVTGATLGHGKVASIPRGHVYRLNPLARRLQLVVIASALLCGVVGVLICVGRSEVEVRVLSALVLVGLALFVSSARAGVLVLVATQRIQLQAVADGSLHQVGATGAPKRAKLKRRGTRVVMGGRDHSDNSSGDGGDPPPSQAPSDLRGGPANPPRQYSNLGRGPVRPILRRGSDRGFRGRSALSATEGALVRPLRATGACGSEEEQPPGLRPDPRASSVECVTRGEILAGEAVGVEKEGGSPEGTGARLPKSLRLAPPRVLPAPWPQRARG